VSSGWRAGLLALSTAFILTCNKDDTTAPADSPPFPTSPAAAVWVELAEGHFGIMMLTIRGPGLDRVETPFGGWIVRATFPSSNEARVLVVPRNSGEQPRLMFKVILANPTPLTQYSVRVDQVATSDHAMQSDVTGYQLKLIPILP
jgi:hypothetical protein